jgi:hypothetical protein
MLHTQWLFLFLLLANCCKAQLSSPSLHIDTLEGIFKKGNQSKDGYFMNGTLFDIPSSIAAKCDNKQIRLLGFASSHYITANDLMFFNNNGNVEYKLGRVGAYTSYELHSIYVFDAKKKIWMLIYNQQEDN